MDFPVVVVEHFFCQTHIVLNLILVHDLKQATLSQPVLKKIPSINYFAHI